MAVIRNAFNRLQDAVRDPYATVAVSLGLLIAEAGPRSAMVVRADDPLDKQAARALPSAWPTPEMTGVRALDTGLHMGMAGASLEIARRTTSRRELVTTALGAQALACGANAVAERSGWLSPAERGQEDVGFSSIFIAWLTKSRLDRLAQAQTGREKLRHAGELAAGAAVILACSLVDGDSGKLDLVAHTAGAFAGWAAHMRGESRQQSQAEGSAAYHAAAQNALAVVENG